MEIHIDHTMSFLEMQRIFNGGYPYLKIEPESAKDRTSGSAGGGRTGNQTTKIKGAAAGGLSWSIPILDTTTVGELEDAFKKIARFPIKIFRKSGNLWIETTLTSDWTLEKQNREGELFSKQSSRSLRDHLDEENFEG